MKHLIIAAVAAVSTLAAAGGASAADTSAVAATITGFNNALNTGKPIAEYLGPSQTVVDEFAPYRWSGPDGAKGWGEAFGGYMQKSGITEPLLKLGATMRIEQDGTHAYVVAPTVFSFKQNGKAMHADGSFAYTLDQTATGWKISSLVWSGPRATP